MTRRTLKTLALAMALFVLAGCAGSKSADRRESKVTDNQETKISDDQELEVDDRRGLTFTDARDGKTYATTKIGEQVWMAENLNYAADSSWCYKDDPANCKKYGRLYTWDAAMKACPKGWHLPTREEWRALGSAIGGEAGTKLKSKEWDGSDALGFNALPAGYWYNGDFCDMGSYAHFWTATEHSYIHAYNRSLHSASSLLTWYSSLFYKDHAYSVRCVKD